MRNPRVAFKVFGVRARHLEVEDIGQDPGENALLFAEGRDSRGVVVKGSYRQSNNNLVHDTFPEEVGKAVEVASQRVAPLTDLPDSVPRLVGEPDHSVAKLGPGLDLVRKLNRARIAPHDQHVAEISSVQP